jgi:hypothetical protein
MTPNEDMYLNFRAQIGERGSRWPPGVNKIEDIYNQPKIKNIADKDLNKVMGVQACLWGEFLFDQKIVQYMLFPRMAAVAELAWSDPQHMSFNDFKRRLAAEKLRYQAMGLNYRHDYTRNLLGSITPGSSKKKVYVFDISKIMQKKGIYMVQLIYKNSRRVSSFACVELLKHGKLISALREPLNMASYSRKANVCNYRFTVDTVNSKEDYQIRITLPKQASKSDTIEVWIFSIPQSEGFGDIPYTNIKIWDPKRTSR